MKRLLVGLLVIVAFAGCTLEREQAQVETADAVSAPKTIEIVWQRYVDDGGGTCDRCGATQAQMQKAYQVLAESFAPEGISVVMEEKVLSADAASADLSQSNRIWIAGRSLEDWLGAEVGMSPCAGCCGELACAVGTAGKSGMADCRTLIYEGKTYEAVTSDLVVKAGIMAASEILGREVTLCGKGVGICTCGGDGSACTGHAASGCEGCPNAATCKGYTGASVQAARTAGAACQAQGGVCDPSACGAQQTAKAGKKTCPRAKQCGGGACQVGD